MKKYVGNIVICFLFVAFILNGIFGFTDNLRKNIFPNDRDKVEKQFYEVFECDKSVIASPFSWDHPGNGKERMAFIVRLEYQSDDFNAYIFENLKFFLHELQTQSLLPDKYNGIAFWIAHYIPDRDRDEVILSFYVDNDTLYGTDWSSISNEVLWNKIGIQ